MQTIGLIGGMSFESSAIYYRLVNEAVRNARGGLHSAEVILHSVDFQSIVTLQKAGRWDAAADRLASVARSLERSGAGCVLICTNTMHLVADAVQASLSVPLINIIDETATVLQAKGRRRPLLLATRYTMEHGFYAERMARKGIDILVPDEAGRADAHSIIFDELCAGQVCDNARTRMIAMIEKARLQGADSVILGCTEICLLLDPDALPLPGFDSTRIHAEAAVRFSLEKAERAAA
ncbi:aspartate/glutamate racemase family protein [Xaviernesmea oryzae]|nr:aspartate/glutamate racemase family protein [Xaviernesmea oryzae]SEL55874.1 aspartate racemase [Xaviernesmea oryzae]